MKRLLSSCVLAGALVAAQAWSVPEARANIVWDFNVTFDDGGTGIGTFTVDTYGYLLDGANSAMTTAGTMSNLTGGPLPGDTYNDTQVAPGINNPADDMVTFFSSTYGYQGTLVLTFLNPLTTPGVDPIIGGEDGPSWECAVGFSCPSIDTMGTPTRYVLTGSAVGMVPEPPAWVMMIVGAGLLAFWKSRRRFECRAA